LALALKKRITAAKIPPSKLDETINVAIWNIREFGKKPRTEAAIHYIAEILGQFDLVALVELRDALADLGKILPILGPSWHVVYSDWIDDSGGNDERTAFLYDARAVTFNGLAAEVDAPRKKSATEYLATQSFWRAPYLCSFRAGNFDFLALATHTRWGDSLKGRQAELQMLADWIDVRMKSKAVEDKDLIVMGDFNIPKIKDSLFNALTSRGLRIPQVLANLKAGDQAIGGSNLGKTRATIRSCICRRSTPGSATKVARLISLLMTRTSKSCFPPKTTRAMNSVFNSPTIFRSGCRSKRTSKASA
jgi:hypothetical protein